MPDLLDTVATDLPDIDREEIADVMAEMDADPERFERHPHNAFGVRGAVALFQSLRKAGRREEAAKLAETLLALLAEHPDLQVGVPGQDIAIMRSYVKEPAKYAREGQTERERLLDLIQEAADDVEPDPSEEQKKAGNFRKGHVTIQGLPITIETAAGQTRRGVSMEGKPWSIELPHAYGYLKRTASESDGDHVDCFVGPHPESQVVFIIDQNRADGSWDEHKVMLFWTNAAEAKQAYLDSYSKGWKGFSAITPMTLDAFKDWLAEGDTSRPVDAKAQVTHYQRVGERPSPYALDPLSGKWIDRSGNEINPRVVGRYQRLAAIHGPDAAESILAAVEDIGPRVAERSNARNEAARAEAAQTRGEVEQLQRLVAELRQTVESRPEPVAAAAPEPAPVVREQAVKYGRNGLIESVLVTDSAGRKTRKVMERGVDGRVVRVRMDAA